MNSAQILFHIELYARQQQVCLAARLAQLQQERECTARAAYKRIFADGEKPETLETACEYFRQPGTDVQAERDHAELSRRDAEIAELTSLILSGGINHEEQAVMLESLCLAEDFEGVARNALNQLCVLVREEGATMPTVLGITFPITDEILTVERAARRLAAAA